MPESLPVDFMRSATSSGSALPWPERSPEGERKFESLAFSSAPELRLVGLVSSGSNRLLAVSEASTAIDRLALYIIPFQIMVLSRLPTAHHA